MSDWTLNKPNHGGGSWKSGFALITTISILVLLALIAVGLLTLSTIQTRTSTQVQAQEEARANARLGLMLALGELQRTLGPDKRVSATASILDNNPETPPIEGVENEHWLGVWDTDFDEDGTPFWIRNDSDGGLRDRRAQSNWQPEDHVLNYLVSGNEGGGLANGGADWLDARNANLGDLAIRLVGPGSVDSVDDEVDAKRMLSKNERGITNGAYAWWVGDLNAKANVALADAHYQKQINNGPDGLERILYPQDVEPGLIQDFGTVEPEEAKRVISQGTLALLSNVNGDGVKRNFHNTTTYSRGVFANTRDGGLQRDVTAYLQSNGRIQALRSGAEIVSHGLVDDDRVVGPPNEIVARALEVPWNQLKFRDTAPRWGLIRRWAINANNTAFSKADLPMVAPSRIKNAAERNAIVRQMNDNVNVYDKTNMNPASFLPHDTPNLAPVMVEGSMYYNLATFPASAGANSQWTLRLCMYPRIALWNPHNVKLEIPGVVAWLFLNGNKRVQLRLANNTSTQMDIPFGRESVGGTRHPAHYRGTVLYNIRGISLEPGETQVFSPARTAKYELDAISRNILTPTVAPDPSKYFFQDMSQRLSQAPRRFIEFANPGSNSEGADNLLMGLKDSRGRNVNDLQFDSLPLIVYANTSLQAGGSDELPVLWDSNQEVPVHRLSSPAAPLPGSAVPDVRTRDGFRLRWWREHPSNIGGGARLANTPHLESSIIGTWNPRAAYFCRNPFDNVSNRPPYFHGCYTRDLYDQQVGFNAMAPRVKNGKMISYPFGRPVSGPDRVVLFEVPREETGIASIGYLRHLKLSEFGWHPSYAVGNSLVDPRVGRTTTIPELGSNEKQYNGWNPQLFGWGDGSRTGRGREYWAQLTRQILFNKPESNVMIYDQSFEANYNLWDDFFFSSGDNAQKSDFYDDPAEYPLPNGRIGMFTRDADAEDHIIDFHRAASRLALEGAFNVNSTSKEAWKAVLSSTRNNGFGGKDLTPMPRFIDPQGDETTGQDAQADGVWDGFRSLSDEEIDLLAEAIVIEVKKRAPFMGLADFVNRRLLDDETGSSGTIESAIGTAALNASFDSEFPIDNEEDLPNVSFDGMSDSTRLDQSLKPDTTAWGIPGHLTQGDVLQVAGAALRARSDSFVIRSYGESVDNNGNVKARAYCEAVVQRVPQPVLSDEFDLNPVIVNGQVDFGRKFRVVSFRWLSPEEV